MRDGCVQCVELYWKTLKIKTQDDPKSFIDEVESVLGRDMVQTVGLARKPRQSEAGKE